MTEEDDLRAALDGLDAACKEMEAAVDTVGCLFSSSLDRLADRYAEDVVRTLTHEEASEVVGRFNNRMNRQGARSRAKEPRRW